MKTTPTSSSSRRPRALTSTLLIASLVASTVLPTVAWAGPEEAARYYEQALEAYQGGDLRKAADLLERAYAEDPDLVYQYNRILALQGLEDYAQAMRLLELYEGPMREDPEKRFEDIGEVKAQLEASMAEAEAAKQTEQAEVAQEAEAPAEQTERTEQTEQAEARPVEPSPTPPEADEGSDLLMWTLLGMGAASMTAGAYFGSRVSVSKLEGAETVSARLVNGQTNEEEALKDTGIASLDDYQSVVDQVETHQLLSGIFLGAGAALFIGGGLVWLMDSGEQSSASGAVPASAGLDRLRVAPYIGADGGGAQLRLDF